MDVLDIGLGTWPPLNPEPGRRLQVAVHGGLGEPSHSVIALYAATLRGLPADLVAIDPRAVEPGRCSQAAAALGLRYAACHQPGDLPELLARGALRPDAVLVLTPVGTHLPILTGYAGLPGQRLFVIEKPAAGLTEVTALAEAVASLRRSGSTAYFIDTAMVAYSWQVVRERGLLARIGRVESIVAVAVDNPWQASDALASYTLAARQPAINERGLLRLATSGGAGAGLDMGIHAVTGLAVGLEEIGQHIGQFDTGSVRLELADLPGWARDPGAETHLLVGGHVNGIPVVVEGGKGARIWDRRIEFHGSRGVLAVGFGTLAHSSYVWLAEDSAETLWRLRAPDTGYANHMHDVAVLLRAAPGPVILPPAASQAAMLGALDLMATWYESVGADPELREQRIARAPGHDNPLLTGPQAVVRARLAELAHSHLRT